MPSPFARPASPGRREPIARAPRARGDDPRRRQRAARGARRGASPPWRRWAALLSVPGLLAKDAGDVQSGLLTVRIWERKHELLGMNSAAKIEIVQAPAEQPSSYERIRAYFGLVESGGFPTVCQRASVAALIRF